MQVEGLETHDPQAQHLKPVSTTYALTIDLLGDTIKYFFRATCYDGVRTSHEMCIGADIMRVSINCTTRTGDNAPVQRCCVLALKGSIWGCCSHFPIIFATV